MEPLRHGELPLHILGIGDAECVHIPKWANFFAARGHKVCVISFRPVTPSWRTAFHPSVNLETRTIPGFHLKRIWITAATLWHLRQTIRRYRPDVVNVHFLGHAAWYAALANLRPLVVTVMGGGDIVGTEFHPTSLRERFLTPFVLRKTDLAVCWSQNLRRIISPMLRPDVPAAVVLGGIDTSLFAAGVDQPRASLGWDPDEFVIFSPRLFRPLSNIETIVRAFASVLRELPRARLVLVKHRASDYPAYTRKIDALIDDLSLRSRVRLLPGVPNAEMPQYYRASDCTVSIPDTDGTPMTALESMACGTPVVIQDLPDYDPTIFVDGETALKVPPREPEALARALLRLALEPAFRETLRRRGPDVAAAHADYFSEMARLEGLYRELVERGHSFAGPRSKLRRQEARSRG